MEKIEKNSYSKAISPIAKKSFIKFKNIAFKLKTIFIYLSGFFCGGMTIFGIFNPFLPAFASVFFGKGLQFYIMEVCLLAGYVFFGGSLVLKYAVFLMFVGILNFVVEKNIENIELWQKGVMGGIGIFLSGTLFAAMQYMSRYFMFISFVEALMVFALTFPLSISANIIETSLKRRIMTTEELMSLALVSAGVICGVSEFTPFNFSISLALSSFVIILSAYRGGISAGTSAGAVIGFMTFICQRGGIEQFCVLTLSGMICGTLRDIGKLPCILSFILCMALIIFYIDSSMLNFNFFGSSILGALIFFLTPNQVFTFINTYAAYEKEFDENRYFIKMKELTEERLKAFSKSFYSMGRAFKNRKEIDDGKEEINILCHTLTKKVCKDCGMALYCWKEDIMHTYECILKILTVCDKKGIAYSVPEGFLKDCSRKDAFKDTINRKYEIMKNNMFWRDKISESRQLVSLQLMAVGEIIENLNNELDIKIRFNKSIEKEIKSMFDKEEIVYKDITVVDSNQRGMSVIIKYKGNNQKEFDKVIIRSVSKATGQDMKIKSRRKERDGSYNIILEKESPFRAAYGVALQTRTDSDESGDTFTFMEVKNGNVLMALSDGMGSGGRAREESKTAIELLEEFMESGFTLELSLKLINSILLLKSEGESFATLDMCFLDLQNKTADFVKTGASISFVIRAGRVTSIKSATLPAGVLKNIDMDKQTISIKRDDIIIMMTDGVADLIASTGDEEEWVAKVSEDFRKGNPEDIAQCILSNVKKIEGVNQDDDMTVAAIRIWEDI